MLHDRGNNEAFFVAFIDIVLNRIGNPLDFGGGHLYNNYNNKPTPPLNIRARLDLAVVWNGTFNGAVPKVDCVEPRTNVVELVYYY